MGPLLDSIHWADLVTVHRNTPYRADVQGQFTVAREKLPNGQAFYLFFSHFIPYPKMSSHRRKATTVVLKEDRVFSGIMDKGLLPSKP